MIRRRLRNAEGYCQTIDESGTREKPVTAARMKKIIQGNAERDICLACTKKKCRGTCDLSKAVK